MAAVLALLCQISFCSYDKLPLQQQSLGQLGYAPNTLLAGSKQQGYHKLHASCSGSFEGHAVVCPWLIWADVAGAAAFICVSHAEHESPETTLQAHGHWHQTLPQVLQHCYLIWIPVWSSLSHTLLSLPNSHIITNYLHWILTLNFKQAILSPPPQKCCNHHL